MVTPEQVGERYLAVHHRMLRAVNDEMLGCGLSLARTKMLRRLHEQGTTILLTTHYLEEAEELCQDVALIRGGRLLARDSPTALLASFEVDSLADVYVKAMAAA